MAIWPGSRDYFSSPLALTCHPWVHEDHDGEDWHAGPKTFNVSYRCSFVDVTDVAHVEGAECTRPAVTP